MGAHLAAASTADDGGRVAHYRVVSWNGIPSLVEADDAGDTVRQPLSQRFQDLIDAVAMRQGASETEAYLEGWSAEAGGERPGSARAVADAVAAELEASFERLVEERLR
jgi:hypothetical protein